MSAFAGFWTNLPMQGLKECLMYLGLMHKKGDGFSDSPGHNIVGVKSINCTNCRIQLVSHERSSFSLTAVLALNSYLKKCCYFTKKEEVI